MYTSDGVQKRKRSRKSGSRFLAQKCLDACTETRTHDTQTQIDKERETAKGGKTKRHRMRETDTYSHTHTHTYTHTRTHTHKHTNTQTRTNIHTHMPGTSHHKTMIKSMRQKRASTLQQNVLLKIKKAMLTIMWMKNPTPGKCIYIVQSHAAAKLRPQPHAFCSKNTSQH